MPEISFLATFNRMSTDKDGESKVTLTVPQSDLARAIAMSALTDTVLAVNVRVAPKLPSE